MGQAHRIGHEPDSVTHHRDTMRPHMAGHEPDAVTQCGHWQGWVGLRRWAGLGWAELGWAGLGGRDQHILDLDTQCGHT